MTLDSIKFPRRITCISGKCYFRIFAVVWTLAIMSSFAWNILQGSMRLPEIYLPLVAAGHLVVWLAGLGGIMLGWRNLRKSETVRNLEMEARLRSDRLAAIVLESTSDAIAIVNVADYTIAGANAVFYRRYHTSEEKAVGRPCYAVTHNAVASCSSLGMTCPLLVNYADGGGATVEHVHVHADGTRQFEEVAGYPIYAEDGSVSQVLHVSRNITERKLAEERIAASEARYRTIFENSGTAIVVIEEDGTLSMVNREFEILLGYGKEEVEGLKRCADFFDGDDFTRLREYQRLRLTDSALPVSSCELRSRNRAGAPLVLAACMEAIPGTSTSICSLLDISAQKKTENALRENEASLALAQKIAHLGNWSWDVETNELHWSDEMYKIYGVDPAQFTPDYDLVFQMVHPDDRERFNRTVNEALYAQKVFEADFRIILPNGTERMLYGQGEVFFDSIGHPLRMVGTNLDISWRIEADRALRNSEEKFSKAFHASPDWIVISRASDGTYLEVNEAFLELTGYLQEEVIGRTSIELGIWMSARDRVAMLEQLNSKGQIRNLEVNFRMKFGVIRTMLWSADVIEFGGEACLIAAARDVTEQRRLEKDLIDSQNQLVIKHKELKSLFRQMEGIRREWEQSLDCIGDMFILADSEGRIKRFNLAMETFSGMVHRDIVGRDWREFLVDQGLKEHLDSPGTGILHDPSGKLLILNRYFFADAEEKGMSKMVVLIHDASGVK